MNIELDIPEGTPEDIVQFIRHLEENVDSEDKLSAHLRIEPVEKESVESISQISVPSMSDEAGERGVFLRVDFSHSADAPIQRFHGLAESFYGCKNYEFNSRFDGGSGTFEAAIFPLSE